MQILGIDFTSAPTRRKPITCVTCRLDGVRLIVLRCDRIDTLSGFETCLARPGPWVAGLDLPFSFARPFLQAMGWPLDWPALAAHLAAMPRTDYLDAIAAFRDRQPPGQKHIPRAPDRLTGGAAPNNIVNPPVGRMTYEALPRLLAAGLMLPGLAPGDPARRALEAYPAIAARHLIGKTPYKDGPDSDRARRKAARRDILVALAKGARFGLSVEAPDALANDPAGDDLDALLCAVQAAWALRAGLADTGPTGRFDPAEGWIADPAALDPPVQPRTPTP